MWHHVLRGSSVVALVASLLSPAVVGQTITFRKVADTSTPVPGGTGTFESFSSTPVIDRGNVAFVVVRPASFGGVYTDIGGTLRPVATTGAVSPDGTNEFRGIFAPSIDDGRVAFRARVTTSGGLSVTSGVYLETSGAIVVVADTDSVVPGGGGKFNSFYSSFQGRPSVNAGNVAFASRTRDAGEGIFLYTGGVLSVVADGNTPTPGGTTPFGGLSFPYLSGDNVAFFGRESAGASSVKGVYARIGGVLRVVADNTMMAPGGTTTFNGPVNPVIDGEDIAFTDLGSDSASNDPQDGSYTYFDGVLNIGILGAPLAPGAPSLENRAVVFNRGPGIITTNMGGSEFHVIGSGDVLDGKPLSIAYQSHEAISGNEIVFFALFNDGTQGIYVAKILLFCGDGVLDAGEDCDDAGASAACDADCSFAVCGDGTLNDLAGEECDDGVNNSDTTPDACRTSCLLASCGDGVTDAGESCDDAGPSAACDSDCTPAQCGDSTLNTLAGEQCDDGNAIDGDGCQADCQLPVCGDGIIDAGETCDDAGPSVACDADCTPVQCGDSTTNTLAGEQCDDGNAIDGDGCQADCQLPVCGDGIIDAGETCDDGALNSNTAADACRTDCTPARCGDGVVDSAEACDDGNTGNGDGCSAVCQVEPINVPTASVWGLAVLGLLLCVGARLQFRRPIGSAGMP